MFTFCWQLLYLMVLDCLNAFLYTMVSCPSPGLESDGSCPRGSRREDDQCRPAPRSSGEWSLSARCANKDVVVGRVTKLNGMLNFVYSGCSVLVTLLAGPIIDSKGRKPVMLVAFVGLAAFCSLQFAASFTTEWGELVAVTVVSNVILGIKGGQSPAANAMVADLSRGNAALRGDAYAALGMVTNAGILAGFGAGYPILRLQLTSYRWIWLAYAAACLVLLVLFCQCLGETLPERSSGEVEGADDDGGCAEDDAGARQRKFVELHKIHRTQTFDPHHSDADSDSQGPGAEGYGAVRVGVRVLAHDRFLRQYLVLWALIFTGFSGCTNLASPYLIEFLGYRQSAASAVFIVSPLVAFFGSALSSPLIRSCGLHAAHGGSLFLIVVGFALCGLGGPLPSLKEPLFWTGSLVGGLGFGIMKTCYRTTLSVRVQADLQGKLFAFSGLLNTLIATLLRLLWTQFFFQPGAHGWSAGLIWHASAIALSLALLWYAALCFAHLDAPAPGKDEESSDGESTSSDGKEEDESSDSGTQDVPEPPQPGSASI